MRQPVVTRPDPATEIRHPRALDHLVLPVVSLETARRRHRALGFCVAPDARHPFGTENCCIFFKDGTYLEPLTIGHRETCEAAALAGNAFVKRDQAWRFRNGNDGFSAVALATGDAQGDHASFIRQGICGGDVLSFARTFDDGKGNRSEGSFKLAFAADLRAPDCFVFTCERLNVPKVDRSDLENHENGVSGIVSIAISEQNPTDFQYFLQDTVRQREVSAHSFGLDIFSANVRIEAFNADGMHAWFGIEENLSERGLRLRAVVFAAPDLERVRGILAESGVPFEERSGRVVVLPVEGQGAIYAFEAVKR